MSDEKTPGPKERPILFSGAMTRAILAGTKTQTRRVLREQPQDFIKEVGWTTFTPPGKVSARGTHPEHGYGEWFLKGCPHGTTGDRLWVRTTWAVAACYDHLKPTEIDGASADPFWHEGETTVPRDRGKLRPGRFWPLTLRHRCPAMLEIVSVRAERLQDISEDDAKAEGAQGDADWLKNLSHRRGAEAVRSVPERLRSARGDFADLWARINGAESWAANPWVWVVSFKRLEVPRGQ